MKANIFNIQKFSLHDGPGIRTTVFFKGCNLMCKWCANPESQQLCVQFTLDKARCTGCQRCVQACSTGARMVRNGFPSTNVQQCILCGQCMDACPISAIGREGREVTVQDVLDEVLKDKAFYDRSDGGVTLSGGEVLMQRDFAIQLAHSLHERGVKVAAETAAAVAPEYFQPFLQEMDYIFIDLKHHDSLRHREGTGMGNEQVIENIRMAVQSGKPYTIRIPVIPGYNDAPDDARAFAELLVSMGVRRVQLLPFHQLGERKYDLLGKDYAYAGASQLHREDLSEYIVEIKRLGVQAEV